MTLHVGPGTFRPVRAERVADHRVEAERFEVSEATAAAVTRARARGSPRGGGGDDDRPGARDRRPRRTGAVAPGAGWTDLTIVPGHRFRAVDALAHELPPAALVAAPPGRRPSPGASGCSTPTRTPSPPATASTATATPCWSPTGQALTSDDSSTAGLARRRRKGRKSKFRPDPVVRAADAGWGGAARPAAHAARHGRDAGLHAGRHAGHGQEPRPRRISARSGPRSSWPTRTTCSCGPGHALIARAGRPAPLHGVGRAHPHRLGRLPGVEPGRPPDHPRGRGALPLAPRRRHGASPHARSWSSRCSRRSGSTSCTPSTSACLTRRRGTRPRPPSGGRSAGPGGRTRRTWPGAAPGQACFGIVQGGMYADLRRAAVAETCALGFDGYALGGIRGRRAPRAHARPGRAHGRPRCPPTARAT